MCCIEKPLIMSLPNKPKNHQNNASRKRVLKKPKTIIPILFENHRKVLKSFKNSLDMFDKLTLKKDMH